jgi:hypothetical protein
MSMIVEEKELEGGTQGRVGRKHTMKELDKC